MTDTLQTAELELTRKLDGIQRDIWARINDEAELLELGLDIADAYSLGSVIKEVLHPKIKALINSEVTKKLEAVLAVLPEKDSIIDDMTTSVTAWHEGYNEAIDDCTTAITNLVAEGRGEKKG